MFASDNEAEAETNIVAATPPDNNPDTTTPTNETEDSGTPALDIIGAFKQGGERNCVTVAIIKAAIEVFGIYKVVQIGRDGESYNVKMRDGIQLTVTNADVDFASQHSNFMIGADNELFAYANFLFAVMAKRAQEEGNENATTYEDAIASLNNGEHYSSGARWLGLARFCVAVPKQAITKFGGIVGASTDHCFYVTYGWQDDYGDPVRISSVDLFFDRYQYLQFYRIVGDTAN